MREIPVSLIQKTVAQLCFTANCGLPKDVFSALEHSAREEQSALGRELLTQVLDNARIAAQNGVPICQDTGVAVVYMDIGQDVCLIGGDLENAIHQGVKQGYGALRKSMLDPLTRKNTNDNTPAVIHTRIVKGDKVHLIVAPKGGGSENMGRVAMLKPSDGIDGILAFVVETVSLAGANPCPPIIVGVGIGGTMEQCALLSKRALLWDVGTPNENADLAALEQDLLVKINALGIGPQGLGGSTTALAVHVETAPCHIASLPVAVSLQCHAARHMQAVL